MFYQDDQYLGSFLRRANTAQFCSSGHDSYGTVELMQFTGLKDRNGVEIYEGDVVRCRENTYQVVVSRACFVLKENIKDNDIRISMQDEYQMEVIGNLHESPHLLN